MEPYEHDELTDRELTDVLQEWRTPMAPARLRSAIFAGAVPWWKRIWAESIRIPVPGAVCLLVFLAIAGWRLLTPVPARIIVQKESVEVPVIQERVITKIVYRDRPQATRATALIKLQPVAELRPRIIRNEHAQN